MDKLFEDIQNQLNIESKKYKRLKICKYTFEISQKLLYYQLVQD